MTLSSAPTTLRTTATAPPTLTLSATLRVEPFATLAPLDVNLDALLVTKPVLAPPQRRPDQSQGHQLQTLMQKKKTTLAFATKSFDPCVVRMEKRTPIFALPDANVSKPLAMVDVHVLMTNGDFQKSLSLVFFFLSLSLSLSVLRRTGHGTVC